MLTRCAAVVLCAVALALLSPSPVRAASDPVGKWTGTTEVPGQGTNQVTLIVKKEKDGYAATIGDSLGQVSDEATDVRFEEDVLTFSFKLTDGTAMKMRLKVAGDGMTGEWTHPEGATGAVTLERKK